MTYHQCPGCLGDGGWRYEDGKWSDCPDCYGWGHVDDGEVNDGNYDEIDDVATSDYRHRYGY